MVRRKGSHDGDWKETAREVGRPWRGVGGVTDARKWGPTM